MTLLQIARHLLGFDRAMPLPREIVDTNELETRAAVQRAISAHRLFRDAIRDVDTLKFMDETMGSPGRP